jgi:outer membrane protein TolC
MKYKSIHIVYLWALMIAMVIAPLMNTAAWAGQNTIKDISEESLPEINLLTLSMAKQIALKNNPSLASALERVNQAKEAVNQARATYFPTISATAAVDYTEETQISSVGYEEDKYTKKLSVSQTLFNGFYRKYSNLSARYSAEMSLAAQDEAKRLLSWSVAQAFLNTQLGYENIKIARADMEFNREQEIEAIAKEKAGTGSLSDVLNFKTKVNSAKSALLNAQQDMSESTHGLAALLGYKDACLPKGMTIAPLTSGDKDSELDRVSISASGFDMETLLSNRPDIQQTMLSVKDADAGIKMEKASYYPTVSLTGAYGTTTAESFHDTDSVAGSLGVYVSFDIFSGGARKASVRKAQAEKRELEQTLEDTKITALSNIKSSLKNITTAREQLALQEENTRLIEKTRDLVEKEFNAGIVSLVRLNEAQNDLVSAMGNLSIARVSLNLAFEEFDYYIGKNTNQI